jgi:NTE family protein
VEDAFRHEFLADRDVPHAVRIPKAFAEEPDKSYHIPWIEMSEEMQYSLDYEGKLDRSPNNVETLIAHGEERGRPFLAERAQRAGATGTGGTDRGTGPRRRT